MAVIVQRYDPKTKRTRFAGPAPVNVIDNNGLQFVYDPRTNTRYPVTGSGARNAINTLYGEPITGVYLTGANRGPNVVDLYGGPNQIEMVVAGRRQDPLTKQTPVGQSITTGFGETIEPLVKRNYKEEVQKLLPYLPEELAEIYAEEWEETGDPTLAYAAMQQSSAYEKYYPGNRRPDGSVRNTEAEYTSKMEMFGRELQSYGVPPSLIQDKFVSLIEGEVSPNEFRSRLAAVYQGIISNGDSIRNYYAQTAGTGNISDAAIFASALTSDNPIALQRQINNAQIGGTAADYGFAIRLDEADRLRTFGLDQQASQRFFSQAQSDLPRLNELLSRSNDPDDDFDISEFADAVIVRDAEQLRRLTGILANEAALFSGNRSILSDEFNRLTGLRT